MMWEWRLNRATGKVAERQLDDQPSEFPRVPDSRVGLASRYGYCMAMGEDFGAGQIFKYDMTDGSKTVHTFPAGHVPGEPSFVPAQGGTNEDDGYLMTYVYAEDTNTSYLVILDATNMSAEPLAQVKLPRRVPTGFHGTWIADQ